MQNMQNENRVKVLLVISYDLCGIVKRLIYREGGLVTSWPIDRASEYEQIINTIIT